LGERGVRETLETPQQHFDERSKRSRSSVHLSPAVALGQAGRLLGRGGREEGGRREGRQGAKKGAMKGE
jgi:hypothetical protein